MTPDRPTLGILLMLGFCLLAPLADALAKILGATIPLLQLLLVRFAVQALVTAPFVASRGAAWRMPARLWKLIFLRTLLHILGIGGMFTALQFLPLADAVAIVFVMPFILLVLGHFVLHEQIGTRRMAACGVGFAGTLLVVQPSFLAVGWAALLPVGVAVIFALFILMTRQVAKQIDPIALQAVSGLLALPVLLPLLGLGIIGGYTPLTLVAPTVLEAQLLLGIGLLGTLSHLLMSWSLRFAPSATLAPMQYLEIPFATLIGYLLFSELPDALATLGITLTIGAGVHIVMREQATARRLARNAPPPA